MAVDTIGRYELLRVLGRGAMGIVYAARDPIIDRQVALKTLRLDLDADQTAEFRERFLREARAAGRLNHPNIVSVHDVGEDPATGLAYIAMEFVEGRDLKQLLASGHRFRPSEAARIVAEVATALDYAHQMKVVHRDVKPANIILTRDGTAKITDFGVARLESSNLTVEGQFIGTPNFMSPEQITGRPVDGRSDLFSLGVVLFFLLTGQRPFTGESMHEVTLRIVQAQCPIPSTVDLTLPPAFNPILLRALEKSPEKRFQSGAELAAVLAAVARSLTERRPDDDARTAIHRPAGEPPKTAEAEPASPTTTPLQEAPRRLTLPPILRREVRTVWCVAIVGGLSLAVVGLLTTLHLLADDGPFPAPSAGAARAAHLAAAELQAARSELERDRPQQARQHLERVLDHSPGSPAARRMLAEADARMERLRSGEEARARAQALVATGRDDYRAGRFARAVESFEAALELDPGHELAASFLELARERRRAEARPRSGPQPQAPRTAPPPGAADEAGRTVAPAGTARITVTFNSPLNAGSIVITQDAEVLAQIPFDFTRKGALGIKRRGTGLVQRVIQTSSGEHRIGVELHDAERGVVGRAVLDRRFAAGSEWTLRIDQPSATAEPGFFLVATRR